MACALCGEVKQLRDSHIIPEFVFKQLYDTKHRFHVLSILPRRTRPLEQKGIREPLLCDACEQKFSVNEHYARGVLLGGAEITVQPRGQYLELSNLDYTRFKLFQMSILWRASVAKHAMFSRVKLGSHEQALQKMLFEENPGTQQDYSCLVMGLKSENGIQADFIDQPTRLRIDGRIAYRFIFAGFMWVYYVSSHGLPPALRQIVLNEVGEMKVWIGRFEDLDYLRDFGNQLIQMDRMAKPTEVV